MTGELGSISGVSAVTVDLVPGGASRVTVTRETRLPDNAVAAALDEAGGYRSRRADVPGEAASGNVLDVASTRRVWSM